MTTVNKTPAGISSGRQTYDAQGYAVFRSAVSPDLVSEAREHVSWLMSGHPDLRPEQLGHTLMTDDAFWVRLVSDSALLDIAEQFIGPDIALFASHYICKPAGDGKPVLWHQDGSYWPLEPMEVVTLWLAVDDATAENGCMRVIPRSHRMSLQQLQADTHVSSVLGSQIDPELVDESLAVDVELQAGDVSVHHPNIIHGSRANTSSRRRCGLTIRYIPTSTRIVTEEQWPSAFLLRGKAIPGINSYLPYPRWSEATSIRFAGCDTWQQ